MNLKVTPMVNVEDVQATVVWYESVGFKLERTYGEERINWALMTFGDTSVMFNAGGKPYSGGRRDVDLYVYDDDLYRRFLLVKDVAEVVEPIHESFYGRREFCVRDPNGFLVTFSVGDA